ncbi:hypothetical protein C8R47DRAFT_1254767 [Mycena vitilis]|nr:hypothetical protein C8R47DRAFT_1254767 [Mycena vitilis]
MHLKALLFIFAAAATIASAASAHVGNVAARGSTPREVDWKRVGGQTKSFFSSDHHAGSNPTVVENKYLSVRGGCRARGRHIYPAPPYLVQQELSTGRAGARLRSGGADDQHLPARRIDRVVFALSRSQTYQERSAPMPVQLINHHSTRGEGWHEAAGNRGGWERLYGSWEDALSRKAALSRKGASL